MRSSRAGPGRAASPAAAGSLAGWPLAGPGSHLHPGQELPDGDKIHIGLGGRVVCERGSGSNGLQGGSEGPRDGDPAGGHVLNSRARPACSPEHGPAQGP